MIRQLAISALLIAGAAGAAAQKAPKQLDVPLWFDRCTALSSTHIASEMDRRCMSTAYDYCEYGRLYDERRPCIEELTLHIRGRTEAIAAVLPEQASLSDAFLEQSYHQRLATLMNDELAPNCAQMTKFMCETLKVVLRWSTARELARTAGVANELDVK
ncbi:MULTISPECIES: hypothetical protein [Phaeobacter]|uniref:hypothetical protein n=1 Tax=Phaeobacter TaxID=302485 RepID=UPI0021A62861|nr:hypothetical protein [Phaeobacter inhibens]UWR40966.1 hypothetical protein K4F85_16275 [Phaeobacter inhibens]UWR65608.1 hypothetical protein K4L02_05045 [Phaeobacter inhibens]UWR73510.1 hypothetical protein K4L00_05210 [Phaeobacter inhibens]